MQRSPASTVFAVVYLTCQGVGIALFWIVLALVPEVRSSFVPASLPPGAWLILALADAVFLPLASLLAAWGVSRRRAWAGLALWMLAGAAVYAALLAVGILLFDPRMWLGAALMVPVFFMPIMIAMAWTRAPMGGGDVRRSPLLSTFVQIVFFWLFFLAAVPAALISLEKALGTLRWTTHAQTRVWLGAAMFLAASCLGLWSAWVLVTRGKGTPLPLDPTDRLVTTGPYAWVRNPMAIAGLTQGLGVACWQGSPMLLGYVALGGLLWHTLVRPQEEADMLERFGSEFAAYRARVRCWGPRMPARPSNG